MIMIATKDGACVERMSGTSALDFREKSKISVEDRDGTSRYIEQLRLSRLRVSKMSAG